VYVRYLPWRCLEFQHSHGSVYLRLLPAGGRFMKLQRKCVTGLTDQSKLLIRYSIKNNSLVKHNLYFGLYYALSVDVLLLLLLLLSSSSSSSSSSSPLCRVFILIFLRQTMFLVLQLFCCYYSWCLYH